VTLSIQEISDRLEILDLLARYSDAVDRHDWDALDDVFTPDAFIDYGAMGGSSGDLATTKQFLSGTASPLFPMWQHMLGQTLLELDGDTARARTVCHNPMVLREGPDPQMMMCGLWYRDDLVRTGAGWRISRRVEERGYIKQFPGQRKDAE
jgi:ketosteroid isomerase-like protein